MANMTVISKLIGSSAEAEALYPLPIDFGRGLLTSLAVCILFVDSFAFISVNAVGN